MLTMEFNYLDGKDQVIGFYVLCGEFEPRQVGMLTCGLEDSLLETDTDDYPGTPLGWASIEIVPNRPFQKTYVICNQCRGVATTGYNVDEYLAVDCPACRRDL